MPNANELFRNEGWHDVSHRFPDFSCVYQSHDAFITFRRARVEVDCDGNSIPLNMNEIIAIYMQCLELGWLYEEVHAIV